MVNDYAKKHCQKVNQFVVNFSLQRPGFSLRVFHIGLIVDILAVMRNYSLVDLLPFSISPMLLTHLTSRACIGGSPEVAVAKESFSPHSCNHSIKAIKGLCSRDI
jgi:hypothetical protein